MWFQMLFKLERLLDAKGKKKKNDKNDGGVFLFVSEGNIDFLNSCCLKMPASLS